MTNSPPSRTPLRTLPGKTGPVPVSPGLLQLGPLILLFVVQVVTVLGVLASERAHTERSLQANAATLMSSLVARASDSTQRYLAPATHATELTQLQLQGRLLPLHADAALLDNFRSVLCSTPELQNMYLARTDGSFVLVGRAEGGQLRTKVIATQASGRTVRLGTETCQGSILGSRLDPLDRYDARSRPWYRAAASSQALSWTDPYVFFTQQIPGITAATSVRGPDGALQGVVGTDVALSDLTGFLTKVPFSAHGEAVIGTESGLAVAYPGIEAVFAQGAHDLPQLIQLSRPVQLMFSQYQQAQTAAATPTPLAQEPLSRLQTFSLASVAYYGMMLPLDIGHGARWLIGVHAPASDFNGEARAQYRRMQITALLVGALSFLLALPLLFRLGAPLRRLFVFGQHFQQSFHFNALLSPSGTLLEINAAALQAAHIPAAQAIGQSFWTLPWWQPGSFQTNLGVPGDDRSAAGEPKRKQAERQIERLRLESAVQRAGAGEVVRFEIGLGQPGQPTLDVDLSLTPVRDPAGRVQFIMAEGRDITEQQHMERALRESEERLHTVLNALDEGVMVQDAAGRVLSVNARAEAIFRARARDVLGRTLDEFSWKAVRADGSVFLPADLPGNVALRTGQPQSNVIFGVSRGNSPLLWLSLNARLLIRPDETLPYAVVSSFSDITARRVSEAHLAHQAQHDALTGLPNRALFLERLEQALASGQPGAVAFLDLDHFKAINDTLGHHIGDQLLTSVAARLEGLLRPTDTVARMGGDEFTLILTEVDTQEHAGQLARTLLDTLDQPFVLAGHELRVSGSLGLAVFPQDGQQVEVLLKHADTAMYHAKTSGKNAYRVYQPQMANHRYAKARQYQHTEIQRALDQQEFVLHYQPMYTLQTGEVYGMEALLRWQHPERGLLTPDQFLPALETSGLIHPAGTWVLQQACREAARIQQSSIQQSSGRALRVAVNVSPLQFERHDFVQEVQDALQVSGLQAAQLELEMTEDLLMNDPATVIKRMRQLRQLGVRLAIDDFGTGYSSLSALRQLPVDILKIDRSFVQEIDTDATLVQAIVSLARNLGMEVVGEGVETAAQLQLLQELGCDRIQGYYAARATPAGLLPPLLSAPPINVGNLKSRRLLA
jgi:diguanylate cyclase (GGDEF)-like protein